MSGPSPTPPYEPNDTNGAPLLTPPRWRLLISSVVLLAILLWLAFYGPCEVARWYLAAAKNAAADMQYEQVVDAATRGLKWDEEFHELIEERASAHLQLDELEASLQDFDRLIALGAVDDEMTEADMRHLAGRTQVLQRLDRYQDAVEDWSKLVELRQERFRLRDDSESRRDYSMALNNRAYTKALGRIDIKGALTDIQLSIEVGMRQHDPMLIDTLGYLLLLDGQNEKATHELENAVAISRVQDDTQRRLVEARMRQVKDKRPYEEILKVMDEQFSVILHHRGEAYEASGEKEKAEVDIAEAKRLGYNPAKGIW